MTAPVDVLAHLRAVLEPQGICLRGIVNFPSDKDAPRLADGSVAKSVLLLGNIGGSIWVPFNRWREATVDGGGAHPLDAWSKAMLAPLADALGATAYFPSDPPWQPFQQWAMQAEGLQPSPLGILIHPYYGLWHGYRGALGFDRALLEYESTPRQQRTEQAHPCDNCLAKPCLSGCPAGAIQMQGFQYTPCRTHLRTPAGTDGCMRGGCSARNLCPVGAVFRYPQAQLRFHMAALGN